MENVKTLLSLGFKKNELIIEDDTFTEYIIGNDKIGIEISGISLVELTVGKGIFITVPNCKTIDDLKSLMRLFNINNHEKTNKKPPTPIG
jgi:hypothetical protein